MSDLAPLADTGEVELKTPESLLDQIIPDEDDKKDKKKDKEDGVEEKGAAEEQEKDKEEEGRRTFGGEVEEFVSAAKAFTPRFSNFHETTPSKVLSRHCSMEDMVKTLKEGTLLWKVRGMNKYFQRHYQVDVDSMVLVGESKKWWSTKSTNDGSEGAENAVPLLEVAEVREGWKTDTFNKVQAHVEKTKDRAGDEPYLDESRCFSVVHGPGGHDVLDLVAASREERDAWVTGLTYLVQSVKALHEDKQYDVWLRKQFEAADKDNNGSLNFDETCTLLKNLNIKMDKSNAKKLFTNANTNKQKRDGEQVLEVSEFVTFYHALLKMPELEKLYKRFASDTGLMSAAQLSSFLQQEQHLAHADATYATKLIQEHENSDLKTQGYMTQDGFYHLVQSELFDVFNHEHQTHVTQDMTRPFADYFIDSSHNTYLTGYQLADASSVEGYISVLKRGCRLLELDLWDGEDGEPVITHAHFTSSITLADVLKDGVKPYAFHASPYPVILSLELHLSLDQQRAAVRLIKEILGDMVATDPVPDDLPELPSPESLKNKIIIRGKRPSGDGVEDDSEDDEEEGNIDYIDSEDGAAQTKKEKPKKPLVPELRQVVNVLTGKKFPDIKTATTTFKCYNTPSIGESKAARLVSGNPRELVSFTRRCVTKVYPLATRTSSSNFKPYPYWALGCQIVALNQQTEDKPNFYNDALFRSNANCGYVLKPDILLGKAEYDPTTLDDRYTKVIRVTVLSGQHLPNSAKKGDIVDPYVQLKVRGHPDDKQKQRTRTVKNNGFNPVWNEVLEVRVKAPQVSLLYFSLRDESSFARDPVLGLYCIPFASLAPGYRYVHLQDLTGKSLGPAALFVHVQIKSLGQ